MLDDSLTRAESHETYSLVLDSQLFEILPQLRVYIYIYMCVKMDVHVGRKIAQQLWLEADSRSGIVTQPTFPRVTILSSKDSRDIKSDIYWGTCAG